jgi:hypothetical protein
MSLGRPTADQTASSMDVGASESAS